MIIFIKHPFFIGGTGTGTGKIIQKQGEIERTERNRTVSNGYIKGFDI